MEASPLMDQKGFVRELEGAYQAMNLLNAWNTLNQNMTYPYLIKKL